MIPVAALLVCAATWVLLPPGRGARLRAVLPVPEVVEPAAGRRASAALPALAAATAATALLMLVGGPAGWALALACVLVFPRIAGRLESRADRGRRVRLLAQAPVVADLLGATMAAGSPLPVALRAVHRAVGGPVSESLRPVLASLDLGADARVAWRPVLHDPCLGALAAAAIRSAESGAPLSQLLSRIAEDLRREHEVSVRIAARAAGVKAVLPLAACFLPAFILLGIVPVVAGLATGLFAA